MHLEHSILLFLFQQMASRTVLTSYMARFLFGNPQPLPLEYLFCLSPSVSQWICAVSLSPHQKSCISYLPSHNKSPCNLRNLKQQQTFILSHSLCGSEIGKQLRWELVVPHDGQAVYWGCSHLKAWGKMEYSLPSWLTQTLGKFVPAIDKRPQAPDIWKSP